MEEKKLADSARVMAQISLRKARIAQRKAVESAKEAEAQKKLAEASEKVATEKQEEALIQQEKAKYCERSSGKIKTNSTSRNGVLSAYASIGTPC